MAFFDETTIASLDLAFVLPFDRSNCSKHSDCEDNSSNRSFNDRESEIVELKLPHQHMQGFS